ncbi:hypothetical protein A2125_00320 [Candidatus Woesebacteria bacterium GWB1_43_5]|uniref:Glycosyltransferase RgtA/B/C/D-like domain-containing protein n=1 Tax=Candidatus Woesebacteria bacterium GWB1_43_5 TaxID=1802474 RepID=A0A1F7WSA2_9BACT|nr:MAG: hypothetical protein A2125_00320 [Candidatus Woesebacteria bacterium GWB1_43_5]
MLKKMSRVVLNQYFLVVVIVVVGLAARIYKIGNPIADWHSWRQADTASVARIYLNEGIDLFYPRYYDISRIQTGAINLSGLRLVEFPLYNLLHSVVAKSVTFCPSVSVPDQKVSKALYFYLFPNNVDISSLGTPCFEIIGRVVSIVFSLISTVLMFLIGRKLYGKWVGILAAFLFAFIPYNIYFSRVILPEPMSVAFALAGLYLFIKFVDSENKWLLYLSGAGFAISFLIKPFTVFYLIPAFYYLYLKNGKSVFKEGSLLIRILIFINISFAPFFAWRIWINKYPIGIPHFDWMFNGDGIRFQPAFWYWIFGERIGKLILGVWSVIPFYLGLTKLRNNLFAHFWMLGIVLYFFVVATANVRHDYYQIILIPPLALMVAVGFSTAKSGLEKLALTACVILAILIGSFQVKEFYKINHPEILVAGKAVKRLIPRDFLIIAPYNGDTAFLYQTERFGWPVVDEDFKDMIALGAGYFVAVNFSDPDVVYVEKNFRVLEKTDQYIIADLLQNPK